MPDENTKYIEILEHMKHEARRVISDIEEMQATPPLHTKVHDEQMREISDGIHRLSVCYIRVKRKLSGDGS